MTSRRLRAGLAALGAVALLLAGSAAFAGEETGLFRLSPENIGPETYHKVDDLYSLILWLTTATFVLTEGMLVFFVLRFRARPGGKAVYTTGNHRLEVVWTLVPGAILFFLAIYQMGAWKEIKVDPALRAKEGPVVEVLGKQFAWLFRYAGPDGKFGTDDDVTTTNQLYVPVDTRVTLLIRSQDVIHSFFLPNLRLKQDAVPGLTIPQWFEARKTTAASRAERKARGDAGADDFDYEIACAELCGIGHTTMHGYLYVLPGDEFWKWIDKEYVTNVLEYGVDMKNPINMATPEGVKYWPEKENRLEDSWLREHWPADLKAKWPKSK